MQILALWIPRPRCAATLLRRITLQLTRGQIFVGAEVEKIGLVSQPDQDVLADHVNFVIDGTIKSINARKEVILAAGVFQSPKLLELSGIGNPEILESISVPTLISNRNVGENLQDHLMAGISYEVQPGVMNGDPLMRQEPEQVEAAMKMYSNNLGGPLAVGGIGSHAIMPLLDLDRAITEQYWSAPLEITEQ